MRSEVDIRIGMQRENELLHNRRAILVQYLMETIREQDWHGVMDAAADLREVDAKLEEVAWVLE